MSDPNIPFQTVTWYDTWNETALRRLQDPEKKNPVPLWYAKRINLAFGQLEIQPGGAYSLQMGRFADQVKSLISEQQPSSAIFASIAPDENGMVQAVKDNRAHRNRTTAAIVEWMDDKGYRGLVLDDETSEGRDVLVEFVTQLGPSFREANLGLAVSVLGPDYGPTYKYGRESIQVFNENVMAIELQNYSSRYRLGPGSDAKLWIQQGIRPDLLVGGANTEPGGPQTSLANIAKWTKDAMDLKLQGMFTWRLSNDGSPDGDKEDVDPTYAGAKTVFDTVANPPHGD